MGLIVTVTLNGQKALSFSLSVKESQREYRKELNQKKK
jgi:hypothetical protein